MKLNEERQKKLIDMVTRLYVYIIKSDVAISSQEINILYSLLMNLFRDVDISWEVYVRNIIDSEYDIGEVVEYLNTNLNRLDKIRILLSLVIMARTDSDFEISEVTEIIELSKQFGLAAEYFVDLMNQIESSSSELIHIPYDIQISHFQHSLFPDNVIFGRSQNCDIRFNDPRISEYEMFVFAIDNYMFMGSGAGSSLELNGIKLKPGAIVLLPEDADLIMNETQIDMPTLWKMYHGNAEDDEIVFHKADYDFIIRKVGGRYSILVRGGIITLNGKEISHGRRQDLVYDDVLQIRGYSPFTLLVVIRERSRIGVDNLIPQELWICAERDFYNISKTETPFSIAYIGIVDEQFYLHPPKKGWSIYLNEQKVDAILPLALNTDIISIRRRNFRLNSFFDLVESPFEINFIQAQDVKHYFPDGKMALDGISFEAKKGELIGVLGQSGCGKSTLMKVLGCEISPTYGSVRIDGKSLMANISYYAQFFGFVPQDDLLYPYLTVFENLWYRGRLRMPNISVANLKQKIANILNQVNLSHRRDTKVGDSKNKFLSGGERKRLNIALELLFEPTVIICDEPTSGLSFSDAEQIIDILKLITAQGKIVLLTIHQPNSSIFRKLDQVLLMDLEGRQAYYGAPEECFDYFDDELAQLTLRKEEIEHKKQLRTSDYMYEVIAYPEYNEAGGQVFEQVNTVVQPKRKFAPEYWRDKYKRKMLYELIQFETPESSVPVTPSRRKRRKLGLTERLVHLSAFVSRSFKMKLRNRTNNVITFVQAPLLGLIISFILRHTVSAGAYSYHQNQNIGIYVFVSIIAFIFLGLSNSIEEILDERKIILREKMMNLRMSYYLWSKLISLTAFSLIQVLLYSAVSFLVLGIRGVWQISIVYFLLTSMVGFSIGLLASSFIKDNKSIINLLPLILIPQIIFGGAVIEFDRMNRSLTLMEKHPIPEVVQVIPSRWIFEGLTTAYAKNTFFHRELARIEKKKLTSIEDFKRNETTGKIYREQVQALADAKLKLVAKWNPDRILNAHLNSSVGFMDGKFLNENKNVFLSSYKRIGSHRMRTWSFNLIILLLYVIGFNLITLIKLKYYFKE
ncbi:MAG: ATP-binding cassette domain-containing protein, partial [Candidatus Cloacimonadaceae bacterium]|nr:ATP-binding cassette domain-containing protein [Candidatus Cloacimonadaceae bacterium]